MDKLIKFMLVVFVTLTIGLTSYTIWHFQGASNGRLPVPNRREIGNVSTTMVDDESVDKEVVKLIINTPEYREYVQSLCNLSKFGVMCYKTLNTETDEFVTSYAGDLEVARGLFRIVNTDLLFQFDCYYNKETHEVKGYNGSEVLNDVDFDYSRVLFMNGVPENSQEIYKAMDTAGISGEFSTDYVIGDSVVKLCDIDTGESKYEIKLK